MAQSIAQKIIDRAVQEWNSIRSSEQIEADIWVLNEALNDFPEYAFLDLRHFD